MLVSKRRGYRFCCAACVLFAASSALAAAENGVGSSEEEVYSYGFFFHVSVLCYMIASVLLHYCTCRKERSYREWDDRIEEARAQVVGSHGSSNTLPTYQSGDAIVVTSGQWMRTPFSSTITHAAGFRARYQAERCGSHHAWTRVLEFHKPKQQQLEGESAALLAMANPACLRISGFGTNQNGESFTIHQGVLSPLTGMCFWLEKSDAHWQQVLVKGTISWSERDGCPTFRGVWTAPDLEESGQSTSFDLVPTDSEEHPIPAMAIPSVEAVPWSEENECQDAVQVEARPVWAMEEVYTGGRMGYQNPVW